MNDIIEFLKVFMPIFIVIDPFGSLVLFTSMTYGFSETEKTRATKDAVVYGSIILVLFALAGHYIIYFFGISIEALEIAGGIILLLMAVEMIMEGNRPKSSGSEIKDYDIGIVPFATPMLAGPGAISLVIILMGGGIVDKIFTIISILIIFGIVYIFFHKSSTVSKLIGDRVMKAVSRIFGLLLAGFAIQYFINAVSLLMLLK
ncbi:MAG: MarC family protein [Thermoplasmata archaeon]